jgi:hypothetical protein
MFLESPRRRQARLVDDADAAEMLLGADRARPSSYGSPNLADANR